jgi:hypothetical protein
MAERLGALGYAALKKEVTAGTAVIPDDYVSLYDENILTDLSLDNQNPAVGTKAKVFSILQGQRSHKGEFTIMAEPNTAAKVVDMLLTKGTTTGGGPYTHPFIPSADSNSYTVDLSTGNQVFRFMGVKASQIDPVFQGNEMRLKVKVSALKAFYVREIATVSTITLTLKTDYDPAPNVGLVVGDLVRITKASTGATLDTTIATAGVNADGITVVLADSAAAFAAGDTISLRPATASYTQKTPFQWARTEFRFGVDSSTALAATQTRVEQSSLWSLVHSFENDNGAERSGAYDPATLVRTTADASAKIKKFFDTPDQVNNFLKRNNGSLVIRHFSETGYEFRVTLRQITAKTGGKPSIKSDAILYHEFDYQASYDVVEAGLYQVDILNNLASI